MPSLISTPQNICILRLSAIGDTCHVVPVLRTLQQAWPHARFTWVIGSLEARLMGNLSGVEFITVDKRAGRQALVRALSARQFDVLLHMQLALRASLIARQIRATVKLGFDRPRARELQWMFTNRRIAAHSREHVMDSFFGFAAALGVHERVLRWDLPIPEDAAETATKLIPEGIRTLIISPCSSHALRNWSAERYAALADYASQVHGLQVLLCGGPSSLEREMGAAILRHARGPISNRIGADTLPQLLALLSRASVLLSPDSGPVHMATTVGTPVIGLYAATNPARTGPYFSRNWCVDAYGQAAQRFLGRSAEQLAWTTKIEVPGVMDLIEVSQVTAKLDALLGSRS
ncbi:MAG TPA: glycosyltransferase family 9 protein [Steroidobacteraceae bacterium]|jgi:heptosyltransferase I